MYAIQSHYWAELYLAEAKIREYLERKGENFGNYNYKSNPQTLEDINPANKEDSKLFHREWGLFQYYALA
jgi:hypothetical protein